MLLCLFSFLSLLRSVFVYFMSEPRYIFRFEVQTTLEPRVGLVLNAAHGSGS